MMIRPSSITDSPLFDDEQYDVQKKLRVTIPTKTKFVDSLNFPKHATLSLIEGDLKVDMNPDKDNFHMPTIYDEIEGKIQENNVRLEELAKEKEKIDKEIQFENNDGGGEISSQEKGLISLLYTHTEKCLGDFENYQSPKYTGREKIDDEIDQSRKRFESERVLSHAKRYKQIFSSFPPNRQKIMFDSYDDIVKKIEDDETTITEKIDCLYELIIIGKKNTSDQIEFVREIMEEPIIDKPEQIKDKF